MVLFLHWGDAVDARCIDAGEVADLFQKHLDMGGIAHVPPSYVFGSLSHVVFQMRVDFGNQIAAGLDPIYECGKRLLLVGFSVDHAPVFSEHSTGSDFVGFAWCILRFHLDHVIALRAKKTKGIELFSGSFICIEMRD
jgi:hypothetical protein